MKVTGRELAEYNAEANGDFEGQVPGYNPKFLELGELCLEAGPKGMRKLAKFLNQCAKALENGSEQDHFHYNRNINTRPQIVILNKRAMKAIRKEREAIRNERINKNDAL